MSAVEQAGALLDVQQVVNEYGSNVLFELNKEVNVTRDRYNSIKKKGASSPSTVTLKAFPITYSPSRRDMDKAGIKEQVDAILYVSKLDVDGLSKTIDDFDIVRTLVIIGTARYEIKEKHLFSQFGTNFLYIVFGIVKK